MIWFFSQATLVEVLNLTWAVRVQRLSGACLASAAVWRARRAPRPCACSRMPIALAPALLLPANLGVTAAV